MPSQQHNNHGIDPQEDHMPPTKRAATRSGNPSKRAAASSVADFKKKAKAPDLQELPSGLVAMVRNRGFQAFIRMGIVPNSLIGVVEEALNKGQPPDMEQLKNDQGQLPLDTVDEMYQLMDAVCVDCFVEPRVYPVPVPDENGSTPDRDEDLVYVDELDDEDKMFIFQWVSGGTRDVEQFRRELADDLALVSGGEALGSQTKPAAKSRKNR
jgi:hypothetical protein